MKTVVSLLAVNPRRVGGIEMFARELSAQLAGQGWESVLAFSAPPTARVRQFLQAPGLHLETFEAGCATGAVRTTAHILRRYRPDILHFHFTSFLTPFPWLARFCGVKQVFFTDHRSAPRDCVSRPAPKWKRLAAGLINLPLSQVVSVSDASYRHLAGLHIYPTERMTRIYNGVDLSYISQHTTAGEAFRRKYGIADGRVIVTQVSSLIPEKGVIDFLHVAHLSIHENPRLHFVLAGDGDLAAECQRYARRPGIDDHITVTGLIEDPLASGIYAATDIFCLLSHWEEAFGLVTAEAMAFGKPVVGTRVGATPELVADGHTGYLVAPGDRAAAASHILALAADQDVRFRMGSMARHTAERLFDLRTQVAQLLRLYGIAADQRCTVRAGAAAAMERART